MTPLLRSLLCRLRGHTPTLQMAQGRIWDRCVECGYETPGWAWVIKPPPVTSPKIARFRTRVRA